jgi:hypothetical protein
VAGRGGRLAARVPDTSVPIAVGILLLNLTMAGLAGGLRRRISTLFTPPTPHAFWVEQPRREVSCALPGELCIIAEIQATTFASRRSLALLVR